MVTGYSSTPIAEARQRLQDILKGIDAIRKIQDDARNAEQYYQDPAGLYTAARQDLLALSKDFDIFKKFVKDNESKLLADESKYYAYKNESIDRQIDFLEATIVTPSINSPLPVGAENDTDVGRSFKGKIVSVADGDTVTVAQYMDETGSISQNRTVRIAGIDTPEGGTSRGKKVLSATTTFWLGKEVTVYYDRHTPNDLYGRVLGTVYFEDTNFALWSIGNCYTEPNLKFEKNHFVDPVEFKQAAKKCLIGYPEIGSVKILSKPPHAVIHFGKVGDEVQQNKDVTPCEIELPIGKYVFIASFPGYSSLREEYEISAEKVQLPVFVLPKIPVETGFVAISTVPFDSQAIVSIDGTITGRSPVTVELPLDVPVKVSVSSEEYKTEEESVIPVIDKTVGVVFTLEKL